MSNHPQPQKNPEKSRGGVSEGELKSTQPMHLVLRLPKSGDLEWIAEQHEAVLREKGTVWFGIRTRPLMQDVEAQIRAQVEQSIPTFLFLIKKPRPSFQGYKARIAATANKLTNEMRPMIPPYYTAEGSWPSAPPHYQQLLLGMKCWIKLSSFVRATESELQGLRMCRVDKTLSQVLRTASLFSFGFVYQSRGSE